MSGCTYSCLIYPEAANLDYVPSTLQLENVLKALLTANWIEASNTRWTGSTVDAGGKRMRVTLNPAALQSGLQELGATGTFEIEIHNERDQGDPTPFEEDAEGIFRPEYCEDAYVFVTNARLAVEDPNGTEEIPCPSCLQNVLQPREQYPELAVADAMLMPPFYIDDRCPHCSKAIDARTLSMPLTTVVDGPAPRTELAPFFRFALWLLPVEKRHPDTERITVDPQLMSALNDACGIRFRSAGTLACD